MIGERDRSRPLRLGTRASPLARWQADWIAAHLAERGVSVEMVHVTTRGDVTSDPIGSIGSRGVFTSEVQRALLDGTIDLAVHSLKDLPTELVEGLTLAAIPPRESPADVLVTRRSVQLMTLPQGTRVGTGSLRRRAQLLYLRPDLVVSDIRGNVDTRIRKLDEGEYDAIILAEAGLQRLGLADRIAERLEPAVMLSAIGQGALAVEVRSSDDEVRELLRPLDDQVTRAAVTAERELLRQLRGGCLAPVGAWGRVDSGQLKLDAVVLSGDGRQRLTASRAGALQGALQLGQQAADELLRQGAGRLIAAARQS